jgi:hypothetical protein
LKNFEKRTEKLDEILSNRRSPDNKTRIGYNNTLNTVETNKSSMEDEGNSRSYKNSLGSGINNQEEIEKQQEHDTRS